MTATIPTKRPAPAECPVCGTPVAGRLVDSCGAALCHALLTAMDVERERRTDDE